MSRAFYSNETYWDDYDGLQYTKHQLLQRYLGGWFPILSARSGRVLYIDCHAGRGRHKTGDQGSPVLALQTLLDHTRLSRILALTEVRFIFFEIDEANYQYLCKEIDALGELPSKIVVQPILADYETELRKIVTDLQQRGQQLAPAFAFLDPYGFKLSMDLLNQLLGFPRCELLINFMYRYVDMAVRNPSPTSNLDLLFGCSAWRQIAKIEDYEQRIMQTLDLFSRQLEADYVTHMYMRASNGALKYVLFHATNNRKGREVMKEAMWRVIPDGSFTAFEHHAPKQLVLIEPSPDLALLESLLWQRFAGEEVRMEEIYEWLLGQLYCKKHLHQVLREYRNRRMVRVSDYTGRFAFSKNPLVHFPSEPL